MTFGEKLSKLRKEYNYTQEQLAEILGVSRQSISKYLKNTEDSRYYIWDFTGGRCYIVH